MVRALNIGVDGDGAPFALPLDYATGTSGILATKGAGKSNGAVVLAEELFAAGVPFVAVDPKGDWHGIRGQGDGGPGLPIPVFGGRHGDIPLEPTAGALVADLVLTQRLTCVLDVSQFTKADTIRFLLAFGRHLFAHADDDGAEPLHLFLEEAHEYLPQVVKGDQAELVNVWQRIVKQGRFKGLGVTLISQRSSVLNKDVLELVDTLIVLRTIGPRSRASIAEWVKDQDVDPKLMASLPSLKDGEAWLWSPGALGLLQRIQFRRRHTFDSGATPKIGEARRAPATLADVDLGALKEAMADTIEKAKAEDPKELRRQIAALQKDLKIERARATPALPPRPEPVPYIPEAVAALPTALDALANGLGNALAVFRGQIIDALGDTPHGHQPEPHGRRVPRARATRPDPDPVGGNRAATGRRAEPAVARVHVPPAASPERADRTSRRHESGSPVSGTAETRPVKAGALRMMQALGSVHPDRLTESQLGTLAKLRKGGTRDQYMGTLRRNGYIEVGADKRISLTDAGFDFLGGDIPDPATPEELLAMWRDKLKLGARRMLDVLVPVYPDGITKEDLGAAVDLEVSGGTFQQYLGTLRRNGLIEVEDGEVRASPTLFRQ